MDARVFSTAAAAAVGGEKAGAGAIDVSRVTQRQKYSRRWRRWRPRGKSETDNPWAGPAPMTTYGRGGRRTFTAGRPPATRP